MNLRPSLASIAALSALIVSVAAFVRTLDQPAIGFVRTRDLVAKYSGTSQVKEELERRSTTWRSELDTLEADYTKSLTQYNQEAGNLTSDERVRRQAFLERQEQHLHEKSESVSQRAQKEQERMITGVLNQLNEAAQQYARDEGFDLVLGTTETGSVLFGVDAIDVTDEVLVTANQLHDAKTKRQALR